LNFTLIGGDQGLGDPLDKTMLLMETGSRYDVIFNFDGFEDSRIIMVNLGPDEPFSGDFNDIAFSKPGPGFLYTDRIMAFDVIKELDDSVEEKVPSLPSFQSPTLSANRTRRVGLFEGTDEFGRLQPLLGTIDPATDAFGDPIYWPTGLGYENASLAGLQMEGTAAWSSPTTENPLLGTTEIWEIWNLSKDAHPIHLHLVFYEVLDRSEIMWDSATTADNRVRDPNDSTTPDGTFLIEQPLVQHTGAIGNGFKVGNPTVGGAVAVGPEYYEVAPKDVVTALPGQITRIRVTFDKPGRYVWHCHILSHEDHEMMRVMFVSQPP
jgi:FtsP/CotA-like multicopper oxidase with cupredoxin domain